MSLWIGFMNVTAGTGKYVLKKRCFSRIGGKTGQIVEKVIEKGFLFLFQQKKIVEKAMKDEAFRKELIKNPAAAVEKAFGVGVPKGIEIVVLEETSEKVFLILPATRSQALSSEDMEKVAAGGFDCGWDCFTGCSGFVY